MPESALPGYQRSVRAPAKVVACDDQMLVGEMLSVVVDDIDGLEFAGAAGDGREAVELVGRTNANVLLLDLHMPGHDGLYALRRIRQFNDDVWIIVYSGEVDSQGARRGHGRRRRRHRPQGRHAGHARARADHRARPPTPPAHQALHPPRADHEGRRGRWPIRKALRIDSVRSVCGPGWELRMSPRRSAPHGVQGAAEVARRVLR